MKSFLIMLVRMGSSFFRVFAPHACRFYPSCSNYSVRAFQNLSFFRAVWVITKRLLKCQPFSSGGWDPAPSGRAGTR